MLPVINIGTRRADVEAEVNLSYSQLLLANRAYERQAGVLKLMQEAGHEKRAYNSSKLAFETLLAEFKQKRGGMSPEAAAKWNAQLSALLQTKQEARARQQLVTSLIIEENKFLGQFGAEVRERTDETHSQRKRRTRLSISRYFSAKLECKYIQRDTGEEIPSQQATDEDFVVTEAVIGVINFLKDATKETKPETQVFVEPAASTVEALTGNSTNEPIEVTVPQEETHTGTRITL